MSFSDIADRLKKQASTTAEPVKPPPDPQEVQMLRARITGVLMRDARVAQGYSVEQVADLMQTDSDRIVAWEFGHESPSLPELELLAYWLEVPVSHFMSSTETLVEQIAQRNIDQDEYFKIRNRMIGAQVQNLRENAGYTQAYLAEQVGIEPDTLKAYEYGHLPISLSMLTGLAAVLRVNITAFLEGRDRVGTFLQAQELFETFLKMNPDVRAFVANPSNHAYIELAMKLADLGTDKLRNIAEDILEITL